MVLLSLSAPILGLIIIIISVVTELAFLHAALVYIRYSDCRQLKRQQRVSVRRHHARVITTTLCAMLAFVALETLTSVFSDPETENVFGVDECIRTNFLGEQTTEGENEAEAIRFRCVEVKEKTITVKPGNYSLRSKEIMCSEQPAYSYEIGESKIFRADEEGSVRKCIFNSCAIVFYRDGILYLSSAHRSTDENVEFLPTKVPENPEGNLDALATKVASAIESGFYDDGEIRRRALLGHERTTCSFVVDERQATRIPLWVIIIAAVVWTMSLLFFLSSFLVKKSIFFDMSNPLHWAKKARHDAERAVGHEPIVECIDQDGIEQISITEYIPKMV